MKSVPNFQPFSGEHCETTMLGNLLQYVGINLSEAMLFGLGEGLGYIVWKMKMMEFPFIGGRSQPEEITKRICRNLGLPLTIQETSSLKKAWESLKDKIDNGIPVGLKVDCYYLDYFTHKFHFNGHYIAFYGYDEEYGYVVDTNQQGKSLKAKLSNIASARNEKGSMASKNLSVVIEKPQALPELKDLIPDIIRRHALEYLNPPIQNCGYKGIAKTAKDVWKWYRVGNNVIENFKIQAMMMEKAGTGGALFRRLYRDFLEESAGITGNKRIREGYELFVSIKDMWNRVSACFDSVEHRHDEAIKEASELLSELSALEKSAFELLSTI